MARTEASPPTSPRDWPWTAIILGYFAFQVLWRRLLGGGLGLDEAQMLVWGREAPALGYGPQPPLYSWLQWAALRLVPDPLLALSLVKNALLATTYLAVAALMRRVAAPASAGLAAASLLLVPPIAWDSQRDMTHSVLAVTMVALIALAFASRTMAGARGGWLLFGLLSGLGAIAKLSVLPVPVALVTAAAFDPTLRPRLRPAGLALAVLVAAAVVAGPAWWAATHPSEALTSAGELKRALGAGAALAGLVSLAHAAAECLALAAVVLVLLLAFCRRPAPWPVPADRTLAGLVARAVAIGLGIAALGAIASGTTHVRDMWILPIVFLAVPLASAHVQARLTERGFLVLRGVLVGLAVLVTAALAVHMRYGDPGHPSLRRAPIAAIAEHLVARFPDADRIVADPDWLAANLIYARPDLPVRASRRPGPPPAPGERVVLVWWTPVDGAFPRLVASLAAAWGRPPDIGEPTSITAPFPPQPSETFRVDAAWIRTAAP